MINKSINTSNTSARIFCIGRNYAKHAQELNNPTSDKPIIFMKPITALLAPGQTISFPKHGKLLHFEAELVLQIGHSAKHIAAEQALTHINAITLGLDLTLRDLQKQKQQQGLPWEEAKAFDQSAPIGTLINYDAKQINLANLSFRCDVNGTLRQQGNSADMLFNCQSIIAYLSKIWQLNPGDLIFTGTPAGVGALHVGDTITIASDQIGSFSWSISN